MGSSIPQIGNPGLVETVRRRPVEHNDDPLPGRDALGLPAQFLKGGPRLASSWPSSLQLHDHKNCLEHPRIARARIFAMGYAVDMVHQLESHLRVVQPATV